MNFISNRSLKWYCDENRTFPIVAILKHKKVTCVRRKMLFTLFKYLSFQRYWSFWNMQISLVMTSYTQPNFDQIWWKRYLGQFESEMFDVLQYDSTKCAPQYERNSLVTMITYCVPDLPNIKGISGHLWRSILICAYDASYARFSKHTKMLPQVCGLI